MSQERLGKFRFKGRLKRLDPSFYRGQAYVHWTMTIADRASGWLDPGHHRALRGDLFHMLARYRLACPVYCLMPDHAHFLFIGIEPWSDQLRAVAWFRREWNRRLNPLKLQEQPYDSVLKETDRDWGNFADLAGYILRNPVRNGLVDSWVDWPYATAAFPGYPKLDPRKAHFWENFWNAYREQSGESPR